MSTHVATPIPHSAKSSRASSPQHHSRTSSRASAPRSLNHSLEQLPLLSPPPYDETHYDASEDPLHADPSHFQRKDTFEETKSLGYLILLTLSIGGLQFAWSVELSSISPFLLELGLSKALLALVWIAGPLSGTLVQPYVGIKSDNCRSRWGRRRPFILGGAAATILSLLALAWTQSIVSGFLGIFGAAPDSRGVHVTSQIWAVLLVYILDFAINVIQAAIRAFIVDCAPTHQQESANAVANIITSAGGIVGYASGYLDLPDLFPFFGDTQFKVLCVMATFAMAITVLISCLSVGERDSRDYGPRSDNGHGVIAFFKALYISVRALPSQVKRVCIVQIAAWIGWFPFLFYTSTYIGSIYAEPFYAENPDMTEAEINEVFERGVQYGTFALLIFSIVTCAASILLPLIVMPSYNEPSRTTLTPMTSATSGQTTSNVQSAEADYFHNKPGLMQAGGARLRRLMKSCSIRIPWLTLRRAWLLSHIAFAAIMWLTLIARTTVSATVLLSAVGIPWALTNWAPFALIAAELSQRDAVRRGTRPPPRTREGQMLGGGETDGSADQAGIVLGIHNVAIAAPQVISTLASSIIFKILQKPRGTPGDDSVGWVLRCGGLCALLAAWLTKRVREGDQQQ